MFEKVNQFFNDIPRILLSELRKNSLIPNKLDYDELIAGISYLSALICNKPLIKGNNLNIPVITKKQANTIVK